MKTILLMRHSQPQKGTGLPNEQIPLSDNGLYLAKKIFQNEIFQNAKHCFSSPYRRACDTAMASGIKVQVDHRLVERRLGDESTLDAAFWARQYREFNFKNQGGESFREANLRMTAFMTELLARMAEGEKAVVVSHAAAICSYLLNFCTIQVLDAEQKLREIRFQDSVVLSGKIQTPCAFVLEFQSDVPSHINYME